jgi:hypothetical protein
VTGTRVHFPETAAHKDSCIIEANVQICMLAALPLTVRAVDFSSPACAPSSGSSG